VKLVPPRLSVDAIIAAKVSPEIFDMDLTSITP